MWASTSVDISSPLLTPSGASSAISSRATSPGGTDTESVTTDNAEDHSNDPQASLVDSRAGEENDEVLFEARAKASKWFTAEGAAQKKLQPGWNTQGLGPMRVLKDKESGRTRVVLRADPGSNIVINEGLIEFCCIYPEEEQCGLCSPTPRKESRDGS